MRSAAVSEDERVDVGGLGAESVAGGAGASASASGSMLLVGNVQPRPPSTRTYLRQLNKVRTVGALSHDLYGFLLSSSVPGLTHHPLTDTPHLRIYSHPHPNLISARCR